MSEYDNKVEGQLTVGLDVGDRYTHACVLDPEGQILEETRFPTNARALRHRFEGQERHRVVLEAGVHSPWISRLLTWARPGSLRGQPPALARDL